MVQGTHLFSEILRICREKQITKILLDVRQSNQAAIAFDRRQGFVEDGDCMMLYGASERRCRFNEYGNRLPDYALVPSGNFVFILI